MQTQEVRTSVLKAAEVPATMRSFLLSLTCHMTLGSQSKVQTLFSLQSYLLQTHLQQPKDQRSLKKKKIIVITIKKLNTPLILKNV